MKPTLYSLLVVSISCAVQACAPPPIDSYMSFMEEIRHTPQSDPFMQESDYRKAFPDRPEVQCISSWQLVFFRSWFEECQEAQRLFNVSQEDSKLDVALAEYMQAFDDVGQPPSRLRELQKRVETAGSLVLLNECMFAAQQKVMVAAQRAFDVCLFAAPAREEMKSPRPSRLPTHLRIYTSNDPMTALTMPEARFYYLRKILTEMFETALGEDASMHFNTIEFDSPTVFQREVSMWIFDAWRSYDLSRDQWSFPTPTETEKNRTTVSVEQIAVLTLLKNSFGLLTREKKV